MSYFTDKRVLCVFAHPDDEVLGCGGTLAEHRKEFAHVHFHWLAFGKREPGSITPEIDAALSCLGYKTHHGSENWYPDNRLDTVAQAELNAAVEGFVEMVEPDIIFTHHYGDTNIDHRRTHEAVVVATRGYNGPLIDVLACEILSSTGYLRPCEFEPTIYVTMGAQSITRKMDAMNAYKSQARSEHHPRATPHLQELASLRGSECGCAYAEAFMLHRMYI